MTAHETNVAILDTSLGKITARSHGDIITLRTDDGEHLRVNRVDYRATIDLHQAPDGTWKNEMIGKYGHPQMATFILRRVNDTSANYNAGEASWAARDKTRDVLSAALTSYVAAHPEFVDAGYAASRASAIKTLDYDIQKAQATLNELKKKRAALETPTAQADRFWKHPYRGTVAIDASGDLGAQGWIETDGDVYDTIIRGKADGSFFHVDPTSGLLVRKVSR